MFMILFNIYYNITFITIMNLYLFCIASYIICLFFKVLTMFILFFFILVI